MGGVGPSLVLVLNFLCLLGLPSALFRGLGFSFPPGWAWYFDARLGLILVLFLPLGLQLPAFPPSLLGGFLVGGFPALNGPCNVFVISFLTSVRSSQYVENHQ